MEIEKLLKKGCFRKILEFFSENPNALDTPRGIATWINQEVKHVAPALDKLEKLGYLIEHRVSSTIGYSYTRDKKKIAMISRILRP